MSHTADTHAHDPAADDAWKATVSRFQWPALVVGGAGLLITLFGLVFHPEAALKSYLWAILYWAMIPLGSLAFLMIQHMTGGTWGLVARRVFEASASLIVLIAVLFLPLLIAVATGYYKLYPWLTTDSTGKKILGHFVNENHLAFKDAWLSPTFFIFRTVLYFGIWTFLAYFLYAWSGREDRSGSTPKFAFRARVVAAPGILIGALAINFAMLDWVMSLDPSWYSTMFGVLYLVGSGLATMAFTIIVLRVVSERRPMRDVLGWQVLNDLGNLMFAFTLLWAYTNFSQFLIQWSGNIAEETPYYYIRTKSTWGAVALLVVIFHFFVPFLILLWRKVKRDVRLLAIVAVGILVMRGVDLFWIVKPMFIQRQVTLAHQLPQDMMGDGVHKEAGDAHAAATPATPAAAAADSHPIPGGADPAQEHGAPAGATTPSHPPAAAHEPRASSGDQPVAGYKDLWDPKNPDHHYHFEVKGLGTGLNWTDIPAFAGIGGIFVAAFVWRLKQRPLLPPNDPRLAALAHAHH